MLDLTIFNTPKQGIFDAASYDEEGVVTDFNNLPTEVAVSSSFFLGYTTFTHRVKYWVILSHLCKLEAECKNIQEHMHFVKTAITPMETKMALTKDEEADEVDVHLYRSMIGSLMYLTASRPDIMANPQFGLMAYQEESPLDSWKAFSDSDYAGALSRQEIHN
ncbi:hypothetical protein Tco_0085710 [Tanacetum coccineum]